MKVGESEFFDDLLEADILLLKTDRTSVAFWDIDGRETLERMRRDPKDSFIPLIPHYDLILTYGGGYPVVKGYREFGARDCIPLYNAHDPATHHPVEPQERFRSDISFVGKRDPEWEGGVEEFLLRGAELAPEKSFLLAGGGWKDKPIPRNVAYTGAIFWFPIITLSTVHHLPYSIFLARGIGGTATFLPVAFLKRRGPGGCVITDFWEGIELFFEPEEEILVARSGTDVAELMMRLDKNRARAIGAAARKRALSHHTYSHRALQFEEAIEGQRVHAGIWG